MAHSKCLNNEWQTPFHVFGPGEGKLRRRIIRQVGDFRIDERHWKDEAKETDKFLNTLVDKIHTKAGLYKGEFNIDKNFVKQASARQGLKINAPDEYDVVIPYRFQNLDMQTAKLRDIDGRIIPGMTRQRVVNKDDIGMKCPRLKHAGVFHEQNGTTYINSRNFQGKVWTAMVDKAVDEIKKENSSVDIKRRFHPPAINLQVTSRDGKVTNFDIVPGQLTGSEKVEIPSKISGKRACIVEFPSYALPKCDHKNNHRINPSDRDLVWRDCTNAYERGMADMCRNSKERQYIMTANRVLKSAMKTLQQEQNPLGNLVTSYHLKNVAYHIIAKLTMGDSKPKLTGVKDALGYQITFLRKCVEDRYLPDFFHGNKALEKIFPGSKINRNHRQQNLFWKANPSLLMSAKYGIPKLTNNLNGCFTCLAGQSSV